MTMVSRRRASLFVLLASLAGAAFPAHAETAAEFPSKPLRWIVPFPPGGIPDRLARLFGERLQSAWGQKVVVENMPGANSLIGNEAMFRAPADGYTLVQVTPVIAVGRVLYPSSKWPDDPLDMFAPVSRMLATTNVIVTPATSPYASIADLIKRQKGASAPELFGVPSAGSSVHLGMEEFAETAGLNLNAVAFKGGPHLISNIVGGHIGLAADNLSNALPHIRSGKVRALMVMSPARNPVIPDVPSSTDAGVPQFESVSWHGVAVRAGTPKAIVDKLSKELERIGNLPEIRKAFEESGDRIATGTPEEFATLIRNESRRNAVIIQRRNVKVQ